MIVHVAPGADLDYWASDIPPEAHQLADAFWPGPLTMILKRAPHIPDAVSGGQDTVGIRCPSHPVAIQLLQAFKGGKGGVAAPSANKFGARQPDHGPARARRIRRRHRRTWPHRRRAGRRPERGRHRIDHRRPVAPGHARSGAAASGPHLGRCDRRRDRPGAGASRCRRPARLRHAGIALRAAHAGGDAGHGHAGRDLGAPAGGRAQGRADPLFGAAGRARRRARCRHAGRLRARAVRGAARDGRHGRRRDPGRGAAAGWRLAGRQRPPAPRRARLDRHRARADKQHSALLSKLLKRACRGMLAANHTPMRSNVAPRRRGPSAACDSSTSVPACAGQSCFEPVIQKDIHAFPLTLACSLGLGYPACRLQRRHHRRRHADRRRQS